MDIYLQWDSENLYLAVVSPETDPHGNSAAWEGDGIQFKLEFNNTITDAAKDLHFTLANDNVSVTSCGTLAAYKPVINLVNGKMEAITKIPFADLGMVASDVKAGTVLAFDIIRISSTAASDQAGPGESESGRDGSYAGWLAWGAFFGIGSSNHPNATAHNAIILSDAAAESGGNDEPEFVSQIINLAKEAGVTVAEDGLAYGHKIVTVNGVTYAVITTQSSLFKAGYMNELTLLKVQDKTVTVEAISYTYAGLEDVIAGEDGKIYILGGATGKDFRQFSSRYSVDGYENEAFLAAWIYDPTTGVMMEHTAYAAFETAEADNFSYLGSAIDEAGLLYVAYIENKTNAPVVEYFAFDPDTLTWDKTAHVLTTNGTVESSFVYVGESGLEMVTAGSEGINIVTAENSSNVAPAGAALKDASQKNDGTLRIVYMNNGKLNYFEAGMAEAVQLNIEVAAEAGINLTTVNKWTLVAVMDADSLKASFYAFTDTANIYALNEILLDEAVLANTADMVMIARKDSQSLQDASVEFMIPGKRGITAGWYFAAITADMSTLPQ